MTSILPCPHSVHQCLAKLHCSALLDTSYVYDLFIRAIRDAGGWQEGSDDFLNPPFIGGASFKVEITGTAPE